MLILLRTFDFLAGRYFLPGFRVMFLSLLERVLNAVMYRSLPFVDAFLLMHDNEIKSYTRGRFFSSHNWKSRVYTQAIGARRLVLQKHMYFWHFVTSNSFLRTQGELNRENIDVAVTFDDVQYKTSSTSQCRC